MNPIKVIPDFDWTENSREEVLAAGQALLDRSDFCFSVGKVAMCGLVYETFTSPPWFWFALARGVTLRDLIDFRRLALLIPAGALTAVSEGFAEGHRFAKFYGFSDTGSVVEGYKIYRRT